MTIKFSWKKVNDKFDWNVHSVLEYFFLMQDIKPPAYLRSKIPKDVRVAAELPYVPGPCYILDIDGVLNGAVAPNDLYMYLELASKRNVFDYLMRGVRHLPIVLVEEYKIQWIELNPLLTIEKNNSYFKYEQEKQ